MTISAACGIISNNMQKAEEIAMREETALKTRVLALLESHKGESVSGEYIAGKVSTSRNSVWKAINRLRAEGYDISAVTNKGYCLSADSDIFSAQSVSERLARPDDYNITVESTVTSTNTVLKMQAENGAPHGTVLIAEEQSEGRGRLGRSFFSPSKTGLYMSVILRPELDISESLFITAAAAVAAAEAIEKVSGRTADIKWVNDIYCGGKKVCGILTEASVDYESNRLNYAVLGIGVNIFAPESGFPDELGEIADSICRSKASGVKAVLAAEILNGLSAYCGGIRERTFYPEYLRRSMLVGKEVTVVRGNEEISGVVTDIDEQVRLVVRKTDGAEIAVNSGEARLKKGGVIK